MVFRTRFLLIASEIRDPFKREIIGIVEIGPLNAVQESKKYYRYQGSITT